MSSPAKSQNGAAEADAAALAEAERLALEKIGGTPKKKPAAAEDNLGKPKATSKKKATPTKKAAPKKALKRPAANKVQDQDDPSGTADQEDDGKEKGLETKATKSKAKKKDVEKAKKLKRQRNQGNFRQSSLQGRKFVTTRKQGSFTEISTSCLKRRDQVSVSVFISKNM